MLFSESNINLHFLVHHLKDFRALCILELGCPFVNCFILFTSKTILFLTLMVHRNLSGLFFKCMLIFSSFKLDLPPIVKNSNIDLLVQVYPYLTLNHMDYLIVLFSSYSSRIGECVNYAKY